MAVGLELEKEAVIAHLAKRFQVTGEILEVEPARVTLAHLHGVAAAETRRMRALLAFQPLELATPATRAIDLAQEWSDLDPALDVLPDVDVNQLSVDLIFPAGKDLESL